MRFFIPRTEIIHAYKRLQAIPARGWVFDAKPELVAMVDELERRVIDSELRRTRRMGRALKRVTKIMTLRQETAKGDLVRAYRRVFDRAIRLRWISDGRSKIGGK